MSVPVLRGGDGRGIKDGKAAALVEGVEVLGGEVGGGKLQAGEYGLNRSIVKFITVWVNKHVDSRIINCYLIFLHPLSKLTQE